jgi:hypothetical protein
VLSVPRWHSTGKASERHLRNVHQWKGKELKDALSYISRLQLQDPHTVDLPPNGEHSDSGVRTAVDRVQL